MPPFLKALFTSIGAFHKSLNPMKKAAMYLVGALIVVVFFVMAFWAGESSYSTLFRDLTPEDSVAVTKWLQEAKIPYLTQEGGAAISVPPEFVNMARMKIMSGGLIQADVVGFEIFNKDQFGMTSFVQKLNYKRAKEGEMVRTIQSLHKVKRARVHITMPTERVFAEDQTDPKASVFVDLNTGFSLTKEDIRGISNLVASSVEGLRPENVSVVDASGRVLQQPKGEGWSGQTQAMLELKDEFEKNVERQVASILEKVVGEGYVEVRANADVDFSIIKSKKKEVDVSNVVPLSSQKQEQVMQGSRPNPTGVPGSRTEIPGQGPSQTPVVSQDVNKTLETINNVVPTTDIVKENIPGSLQRLTIAVILDPKALNTLQPGEKRDTASDDKKDQPEAPQKLSPEVQQKLTALVQSAMGFDEKRGDRVQIEVMPFARPELDEGDRQLRLIERRAIISNILQFGIPSLFLFCFFIWVVRPFIKWVTTASSVKVEEHIPQTVEELEAATVASVGALAGMENLPLLEEKVDPDKAEGEMLKEKILSMVEAAPQKAAQVVQDWLAEDLQKKKRNKDR